MPQRKVYTEEFKRDAVRFATFVFVDSRHRDRGKTLSGNSLRSGEYNIGPPPPNNLARQRICLALKCLSVGMTPQAMNSIAGTALRETNISHLLILGRPIVPMSEDYRRDEKRWERDKATLYDITKEFERKAQAGQKKEQQKGTATERTAIVVSSTR